MSMRSVAPSARLWVQPLCLALCSAVLVWSFSGYLPTLALDETADLLRSFPPATWILAAAFVALSFFAVAQYDRLFAGYLGVALSPQIATSVGWRATALSQASGFGLLVGTLVRARGWRNQHGPGLPAAFRMTLAIGMAFLAALGALIAVTTALVGHQPAGLPDTSALWLFGLAVIALFGFARPLGLDRVLPPVTRIAPVLLWTLLDTLAAALVIFIFLPEGYAPFLIFYMAFLIALGSGMLSGLPGGVGPFELCLFTILAPADPAPLLSAILAYRLLYFIAPAALALPVLAWPPARTARQSRLESCALADGPAEASLTIQGRLAVRGDEAGAARFLCAVSRNSLIALGDAFGTADRSSQHAIFETAARQQGKAALHYKCSAREAAILRRAGRLVLPIGSEAELDPANFTLDGSGKRQLRRKLRNAEKADVVIDRAWRLAELEQLDRSWCDRNGGAKGFSMGVFSGALLERSEVFVARINGKAVAFISFLTDGQRWVFDLVRNGDCPDGAMHLLIARAMETAKARKIETVSLAAAPLFLAGESRGLWADCLTALFQRNPHLKGLRQFKASFDPCWRRRYVASRGPLSLALGLRDLYREIHLPEAKSNNSHNEDAKYEFASPDKLCEEHAVLQPVTWSIR